MPGQRFCAPHIDDINPLDCCAYNNVVIMCGINDLKRDNIRSEQDIENLYNRLKIKFRYIRNFNPRVNLFVCSILPTKSHDLNKRAMRFNDMIFSDLVSCDLRVTRVHGLHRLLDSNDLLSSRLSRHLDKNGRVDLLHINDAGTRLIAGLIKTAVFLRLNKAGDRGRGQISSSRVNERLFSSVTQGPQSLQQGGGQSYQV